ncbi:MAG TPA: hypothetical protein VFX98_01965 [Longimicrobiaceae bacterium]|nr:hypothetical protein [Longimicrobiaceae bacterium]
MGRVPALLLALALAAPLAAQDTIPRRDTAQVPIPPEAVRADTLPARDTVPADSTLPAPNFPVFPAPRGEGFPLAAWSWDRAALARFHGMGITELLESVPGLVITRAGSFGRPAGVAAFGAGGGRLRVFLDGFELRPTEGAVPDLQRIQLVDLETLRVERRLTETRVELTTFRLGDRRPFAQIEGADGDFNSRFLRGFFARPLGGRVLAQVGLDLVETDGFRRAEPFGANTQLARLSYLFRPDLGVQVEYRSSKFDSETRVEGQTSTNLESSDRSEWIVRGRGRLGRLWLDGQLGRTTREPQGDDPLPSIASTQAVARATLDVPLGALSAAARLHRGTEQSYAPDATELSVRADLTPAPWLVASGEARSLTLDGEGGVEIEGAARAGPFGGFSLLGGFATGSRGIAFRRDSTILLNTIGGIAGPPALDTVRVPVQLYRVVQPSLAALRAGAEWARGRVRAGAAYVLHDPDEVAPFGLSFDRGAEPVEGGAASGVEAYLSVPVWFPELRLDAWYTRWLDAADRPFLPEQQGWAALEFHDVYRAGNFEPTLRVEMVARDGALLLDPATGVPLGVTPRYALFNFYVQVRILDVRIFYRLENLANRNQAQDVPGFFLPGTRALYGLRWFFRN